MQPAPASDNRPLTPRTQSDWPGENDLIGVGDEARAFARLIAARQTQLPLSIGIFGHWGSGKTFFLNDVRREVERLTQTENAGYLRNIVAIEFNAWHYMEANIWASLVDVIFRGLDSAKTPEERDKKLETGPLFEKLAVAQTERLDAIEIWAKQLNSARLAQDNLIRAREDFSKCGPTGSAYLNLLLSKALKNCPEKVERAKNTLKSEAPDFKTDAEAFGAALKRIRESREKGTLAYESLHRRMTGWGALALLAVGIFGVPFLVDWVTQG